MRNTISQATQVIAGLLASFFSTYQHQVVGLANNYVEAQTQIDEPDKDAYDDWLSSQGIDVEDVNFPSFFESLRAAISEKASQPVTDAHLDVLLLLGGIIGIDIETADESDVAEEFERLSSMLLYPFFDTSVLINLSWQQKNGVTMGEVEQQLRNQVIPCLERDVFFNMPSITGYGIEKIHTTSLTLTTDKEKREYFLSRVRDGAYTAEDLVEYILQFGGMTKSEFEETMYEKINGN